MQGFESVAHGVPSVALPCTHPLAGLHESVVHGSPSSQFSAVPPLQTELALQVVPTVHAFPSSQALPVSGSEKQPLGSAHCPAWQSSVADAEQSLALPPPQTPF